MHGSGPLFRLHLDFDGPFMGHMIIMLVASHYNCLEDFIMSKIIGSVTMEMVRSIFAVHGFPDTVIIANGPTFSSEVSQEFMEKNEICHIRTAPYHTGSKSLAEPAVETLKDGLQKMAEHLLWTVLSCS